MVAGPIRIDLALVLGGVVVVGSLDREAGILGTMRIVTPPEDDRIELGRLIGELWRRKWMVLLAAVLGAVLTFLLMVQVTPNYTANTSIMLDPRTVQVLASNNVVSDLNLNDRALDTEVAVLTSNVLLERVLADFDADKLEILDPANREPTLAARALSSVRGWGEAAKNMFARGGDKQVAAPIIDEEARRMRRLTGALKSSLHVRRVGDAYLIAISVETSDPQLSTDLANAIVKAYIAQQIEQTTDVIRNATRFLQDRVDEMGAAVEAAEERIEDFRAGEIAQSGLSQDTIERQLQDLSSQLALAQADLAQAQARYNQIKSVVDTKGIDQAAQLLTSQFVLSLREQLSEATRRDADLSARYAADHPDRVAVGKQIELLERDLRQEVRQIVATLANDVDVALSRVASLQANVREMEGRAAEVSRANLALRQLEREADALRENYQSMLNRLNETRSTELLQTSTARQIERAVIPGAPSSPRVMLFTAFGGTVGFALGLVAAFMMVVSSSGFRDAREIEGALELPVLASLVKVPGKSIRAVLTSLKKAPYQQFAERLRQLRMALFTSPPRDSDGTCVLVTSSVADEGKTLTTLSLALMETLSDRRCVVLDLDLRQSQIVNTLGYDTPNDLVDVLNGTASLDAAIFKVPDAGFDVITSKTSNPRLVDTTSVDRLKWLISELKRRYQVVLIDTGPVLMVSDTLKLAPLADQVLLLIRQNRTRRKLVTEAARSLEDLGARSISAAITMADPRSEQGAYGSYRAYSPRSPQ